MSHLLDDDRHDERSVGAMLRVPCRVPLRVQFGAFNPKVTAAVPLPVCPRARLVRRQHVGREPGRPLRYPPPEYPLIVPCKRPLAFTSGNYRHVVFPRDMPRRRSATRTPVGSLAEATAPTALLDEQEIAFCERLFSLAGLNLSNYRQETIHRRLAVCLRALRAASLTDALARVESRPALVEVAINSLLVGVTSFFRDEAVFSQLEQWLPTLARQRRQLSFWSAGCSDGAELYSLAMLLAERGLLADSYLLGTDCRAAAIAAARAGRFHRADVEQVRPDRRDRFFKFVGHRATVVAELRAAARWRVSSLVKHFEPGAWDLISLRNTTIYLRPEVVRGLWQRIESGLRPDGLLVLGKAERPLGATRLHQVGPCIYQRARR